jgi:hypothetical protein
MDHDLRTVVTDAVAQRRLVDEVYAQTGKNSPASATITEFYSKSSPFDLLTKETVDASVESIVQQSPKTYEVAWTEVTRDLSGNWSPTSLSGLRLGGDARSHGRKTGIGQPARPLRHESDLGRSGHDGRRRSNRKCPNRNGGKSMKWLRQHDGSPNSECGGRTANAKRSGTHTTAKARAVRLQLQRRGAALEAQANQPAPKQAADSDSSAEGSADCQPSLLLSLHRLALSGQGLGGSAELEAASRGVECRRGQRGGGFASMGDRSRDANARSDGRVVYIFGQGMPVMVCAPLRVCAIELQARRAPRKPAADRRFPPLGDHARSLRLRPR